MHYAIMMKTQRERIRTSTHMVEHIGGNISTLLVKNAWPTALFCSQWKECFLMLHWCSDQDEDGRCPRILEVMHMDGRCMWMADTCGCQGKQSTMMRDYPHMQALRYDENTAIVC